MKSVSGKEAHFMEKKGWLSAGIGKAYRYCKRNGAAATVTALAERLICEEKEKGYTCPVPDQEILDGQRAEAAARQNPTFLSVAVPACGTKPEFLEALLTGMQEQTWPHWELIIADAGGGNTEQIVRERQDPRIRYLRLAENRGIAENTNAAIRLAQGEYIGLLDHDDFLTPDALYEMEAALRKSRERGIEPLFLYSDEDKCDESGTRFYEPHRKPDFNPDLLLSNNYICHFLMMEAGLMKRLLLRSGYDGAQDYDLVLRASGGTFSGNNDPARHHFRPEEACVHVPKVLYHWRCHQASTAVNPESKSYAYEAGKRALEDFAAAQGWKARAEESRHLGFYRLDFGPGLPEGRKDLGAVAGPLPPRRGRLRSGIYDRTHGDGEIRMRYEGLWKGFSGPFHRASLTQDVEAADVRTMQVRPELEEELREALLKIRSGEDPVRVSLEFGERIRNRGLRILWDPCRKGGAL